ncbi:MAG TPA: imidazole glycerol phosphate synthase subunit HisH [Steroidobacteraceae bacterium]|nr:imidazole glycerol phosphate synthase subunit HisH [Steroidobacteraceae bacterium]
MKDSREVIIIDSGGANLASLEFALERLGARARVSSDAAEIAEAARLILPGVGSARDAMQRLESACLVEPLRGFRRPVLGICLGMQLLFQLSAEGATPCLGVLGGTIERLQARPGLPVPHMGWNQLALTAHDPLLDGIAAGDYVYFVHSYAAPPSEVTLATAHYGADVSAAVRSGNFWGTQFHPERSGSTGARILGNFLRIES